MRMFSGISRRIIATCVVSTVDLDALTLQGLPPSEGEQLPGELAGLLDRSDNRPERRLALVGLIARDHREAGVAPDHLEQVVEVVGDAAGEQTDGFQLLCLP